MEIIKNFFLHLKEHQIVLPYNIPVSPLYICLRFKEPSMTTPIHDPKTSEHHMRASSIRAQGCWD